MTDTSVVQKDQRVVEAPGLEELVQSAAQKYVSGHVKYDDPKQPLLGQHNSLDSDHGRDVALGMFSVHNRIEITEAQVQQNSTVETGDRLSNEQWSEALVRHMITLGESGVVALMRSIRDTGMIWCEKQYAELEANLNALVTSDTHTELADETM